MFRILVAAVAAAGLAFAASPAAAEAPFVGPDCQGMIVSKNVAGIGANEAAAALGMSVQEAADWIRIICTDPVFDPQPPICEFGQGQAADAANERGDEGQYLFHLGLLWSCFINEPPGATS